MAIITKPRSKSMGWTKSPSLTTPEILTSKYPKIKSIDCNTSSFPRGKKLLKVQKRDSTSTNSNRRKSQVGDVWISTFEKQIDLYRQNIGNNANNDLNNAEKAHYENLDRLANDYGEKISNLTKLEQPLLQSLSNEILRIEINEQELVNTQQQFREVILQDRMLAFKKILDEEHEILRDLLHDWSNVQAALLKLTVKLLGLNILDFEEELYDNLKIELEEAAEEYSLVQHRREAVDVNLVGLEHRVTALITQTKTTMDEQVKTCKLNRRKHIDQMNEALKWLHEDS